MPLVTLKISKCPLWSRTWASHAFSPAHFARTLLQHPSVPTYMLKTERKESAYFKITTGWQLDYWGKRKRRITCFWAPFPSCTLKRLDWAGVPITLLPILPALGFLCSQHWSAPFSSVLRLTFSLLDSNQRSIASKVWHILTTSVLPPYSPPSPHCKGLV